MNGNEINWQADAARRRKYELEDFPPDFANMPPLDEVLPFDNGLEAGVNIPTPAHINGFPIVDDDMSDGRYVSPPGEDPSGESQFREISTLNNGRNQAQSGSNQILAENGTSNRIASFSGPSNRLAGNFGTNGTHSNCLFAKSGDVPSASRVTREIMLEYMHTRSTYDCVVSFAYPLAVPKSYVGGRRFFCPPPSVTISGGGWKLKARKTLEKARESGQNLIPSLETRLCAAIGVIDLEKDIMDLTEKENTRFARSLHIPPRYERRFTNLKLQLFYAYGDPIGTFETEAIKIISKPNQNASTEKVLANRCAGISSGSKIALFNRAEKAATRYMRLADDDSFFASNSDWTVLSIHTVTEGSRTSRNGRYDVEDGPIYYGATVLLMDLERLISFPLLRIRKVIGHCALLNNREPVTQLQNCAFEVLDSRNEYLGATGDKIMLHTALQLEPDRHEIGDFSIWKIVNVEKVDYHFYESLGEVPTLVTPVPIVSNLEESGSEESPVIYLNGKSFTANLQVWFGSAPADTVYMCQEIIRAEVPPLRTVLPNWLPNIQRRKIKVPLSLVREDGVIYPTNMQYAYSPSQACIEHNPDQL